MRLVFLYGEVASGKLTVARRVAEASGYALFHNHLVVDAVAALFPFGSAEFVAADRAAFGKLRSIELLRALKADFARCTAAMPAPVLAIDTAALDPEAAAAAILARLALP